MKIRANEGLESELVTTDGVTGVVPEAFMAGARLPPPCFLGGLCAACVRVCIGRKRGNFSAHFCALW